MSLEQIVMTQCDEPTQKNCIYNLYAASERESDDKYF